MKCSSTLLLIAFAADSSALFAETDGSRELNRLRDDRSEAIRLASEPINRRYKVALEQLLRKATQANDLETAVNVKKELADLETPDSKNLTESTWIWRDANGGTSPVHFDKDGQFRHPAFGGTWKRTTPRTVVIEAAPGTAKITFNEDFTSWHGTWQLKGKTQNETLTGKIQP